MANLVGKGDFVHNTTDSPAHKAHCSVMFEKSYPSVLSHMTCGRPPAVNRYSVDVKPYLNHCSTLRTPGKKRCAMPESRDYQGFGKGLEATSYLVRLAHRRMKFCGAHSRFLRIWESFVNSSIPHDSQTLETRD